MTSHKEITTKTLGNVKVSLFIGLGLILVIPSHAAVNKEFSTHDTDTFMPYEDDEKLPAIEARSYETKPLAQSESGRAYLFKDPLQAKPMVGRIILLKQGGQPVMAFRVLRTFPERSEFIAKRVRRYGDKNTLEVGANYRVLERISEYATPLPPNLDDEADIADLDRGGDGYSDFNSAKVDKPEKSSQTLDDELLMDANPQPKSETQRTLTPSEEDQISRTVAYVADDVEPHDRHRHALSAEFGFLQNRSIAGASQLFHGGGMRYALTLGKSVFFNRSTVTDSIAAEGGMFWYSVSGYQTPDDSYTVFPLVATLRYNVFPSDVVGIFFYGGIMDNYVPIDASSTAKAVAALSGIVPAAGAGLIFHLGPHWDARIDAGIDMFASGLMIRF